MAAFDTLPIVSVMRILMLVQTLLILLPSVIYFAVKLRRNWNEFYMKKRGPNLILFTFLVAVWGPLIQNPYWAIISLVNPNITYYTSDHEWILYPSVCCRSLEISLIALRVYLLWFEQKHADLVASAGWRILMDPDFGENNWFYQKSTTFGSSKWMIKWVVLPSAFVWCSLWGIAHYYFRYQRKAPDSDIALVYRAFTGSWLLFCCCFVVFFWNNYSSFMDNLKIRQELKGIITIMAMVVVLNCIGAVVLLKADRRVNELSGIILTMLISFAQIAVGWFMMVFPQRKWEAMNGVSIPELNRPPSKSSNPPTPAMTHTMSKDIDIRPSDTKSWTDIVSELEEFTSFCNFLHFGFAAENLLYIVEYMAIKTLVQKSKLVDGKELPFDLRLPDKLKVSSIAKEYKEKGVLQVALWDLYNKYVNPDTAHLEINVSWSLRERIRSLFASHDKEDISTTMSKEDAISALVLFEEAAESVAHLMNDTFLRFRKTDVYRELVYRKEKRRRADLVNPSMTHVSSEDVATIYGQGKDNMLW